MGNNEVALTGVLAQPGSHNGTGAAPRHKKIVRYFAHKLGNLAGIIEVWCEKFEKSPISSFEE